MLTDVDPVDHSAESLREVYERTLRETIETIGVSETADTTGLKREIVERIAEGRSDAITLTEATAVLAAVEDRDAEAIAADARDRLLLSMSTAVLDVEALARHFDGGDSAKELQAKIEGRHPMTLSEYARVRVTIAGES